LADEIVSAPAFELDTPVAVERFECEADGSARSEQRLVGSRTGRRITRSIPVGTKGRGEGGKGAADDAGNVEPSCDAFTAGKTDRLNEIAQRRRFTRLLEIDWGTECFNAWPDIITGTGSYTAGAQKRCRH